MLYVKPIEIDIHSIWENRVSRFIQSRKVIFDEARNKSSKGQMKSRLKEEKKKLENHQQIPKGVISIITDNWDSYMNLISI